MFRLVFAPFAITRHGEWVTPVTAAQEDYDNLFCEYCRMKIGITPDERAPGGKLFVHIPTGAESVKLITACRYNKVIETTETTPKSPIHTSKSRRQLPCHTTKQRWRCCRCNVCWYGEKQCTVCHDWMYVLPVA